MPIDSIYSKAIDAAKAAGRKGLSEGSVVEFRSMLEESARLLGPGPDVEQVTLLRIPTRAGLIEGVLYRPIGLVQGLVVYLHGGGWLGGSRLGYDQLCRQLASLSGYSLLFVDYRLAPEHRFPAGLQDIEDALEWANANRRNLGAEDGELVIAGDSAGANLSAVVSQSLKDRMRIARQVLFYPVTDADFGTESYCAHSFGLNMTRRDMQWFFENYAESKDWHDSRISPLRGDLQGTPPTWIGLAEYDALSSEGEAYARALARSGVPVQMTSYAGAVHGFAGWFGLSEVARAATQDAALAISRPIRASEI